MWGSGVLGRAGKALYSGGLWGGAAAMTGWGGAGRILGRTGRAAATGALAGGMWGAMSSDTSVLGGAMMGAGLGVGARYGRIAYGGARFGGRLWQGGYLGSTGMGRGVARGAMRAVRASAMRDTMAIRGHGTRLWSNLGFGRIPSMGGMPRGRYM